MIHKVQETAEPLIARVASIEDAGEPAKKHYKRQYRVTFEPDARDPEGTLLYLAQDTLIRQATRANLADVQDYVGRWIKVARGAKVDKDDPTSAYYTNITLLSDDQAARLLGTPAPSASAAPVVDTSGLSFADKVTAAAQGHLTLAHFLTERLEGWGDAAIAALTASIRHEAATRTDWREVMPSSAPKAVTQEPDESALPF